MIKVKLDRPVDNVFYVEDGVTVSYNDDVLEVADEDDAIIAVFRGWVFALPITDEEFLVETGQAQPEAELDDEDLDEELEEVDFEAPEPSSFIQVNGHGTTYGPPDDAEPAAEN